MAWGLGIVVAVALAAILFAAVGWLGIGLLGLVGLLVSTRLDLHGGHAVPDMGQGSSTVQIYAKQLKERDAATSPVEKMAAAAERAKRARVLYAVNTVFIAMIAFGFGLFFLHQV